MSEILSQSEIEALLSALATDAPAEAGIQELGLPAPGKPGVKPATYEIYDFRRPDKFSRDQLRTLQMVHDTFARLCTTSLSAYLRTPVHVELISLEQVPFEEYMRSLNQSVFIIFSTPPLAGQSVLEMEFPLMFTLLDRLLGGPGRSIERSTLTDIERPLVMALSDRILIALKSAWESIVPLEPHVEGLESSAQFVQIAPPNDIVITVLMEVRAGEQRGAMSVCIPHLVFKPITPKLSSQKWIASTGRHSSPHIRQLLTQQLNHATLPCIARLGKVRLQLRQLLDMKVGDILVIDTPVNGKADLLVGGRLKFRGRPAIQNRKLVLTITDVISGG